MLLETPMFDKEINQIDTTNFLAIAPKLSIVIPTYNRAEYLKKCLNSVLANDYQNLEILVCDNASEDNTLKIINSFNDTRLKYLRNEKNIGPERNVLKLLQNASGEYIFFLTDDDLLNENAILETIKIINRYPYVGIILSALNILDDKTGKLLKDYTFYNSDNLFQPGKDALLAMFNAGHVLSRITIRREIIDIDGYKRYIGSLYPQMYLIGSAMKKFPVYYTNKRLVTHRVNNKIYWEYVDDYMFRSLIRIIKDIVNTPEENSLKNKMIQQIILRTRFTMAHSRSVSIRVYIKHIYTLLSLPEIRQSPIFWRNYILTPFLVLNMGVLLIIPTLYCFNKLKKT